MSGVFGKWSANQRVSLKHPLYQCADERGSVSCIIPERPLNIKLGLVLRKGVSSDRLPVSPKGSVCGAADNSWNLCEVH